ncbi:uncharacterized protein EI97DRAFT_108351 [Westerdykella ornata]|uniref:Uncharacterized protein n=1 Tax=Westerdykella ornata TaxID=318751 RepID=A0A6A6JTX4_WESOR|nr:uncharacterized protein EI97DRAFT_108351 [Westerdykella ornata]KAF2280032.1 hypothetical protein EI97DRAFT_108351 [Westerdykella ornata]
MTMQQLRATAVSPRHAEPLHLRMRLQRQRFASNARLSPLAEAQASISRDRRTLSHLHFPHHIILSSSKEPRPELAVAWPKNRRWWTREA